MMSSPLIIKKDKSGVTIMAATFSQLMVGLLLTRNSPVDHHLDLLRTMLLLVATILSRIILSSTRTAISNPLLISNSIPYAGTSSILVLCFGIQKIQ
jgi:CHASE2 domain-containing sensor protein